MQIILVPNKESDYEDFLTCGVCVCESKMRKRRWQWRPEKKASWVSLSFESLAQCWRSVNNLGAKLNLPVTQPLNNKPWLDASLQPHFRAHGVLQQGLVTPGGRDHAPGPPQAPDTHHLSRFSPHPLKPLGLGAVAAGSQAQLSWPSLDLLTQPHGCLVLVPAPALMFPPSGTRFPQLRLDWDDHLAPSSSNSPSCSGVSWATSSAHFVFSDAVCPLSKHISLPWAISLLSHCIKILRRKWPHSRHQQECRNAVNSWAINSINKQWFTAFNQQATFTTEC